MYNTVFDALYWLFGALILVTLVASLARAAAIARGGDPVSRAAQASGAAAAGALLALVSGFAFNALRPLTGDLVYQQAHFIAFYVAFGLVLWAVDRLETSPFASGAAGRVFWWRLLAWTAFGLSSLVALGSLLMPAGYRVVGGNGDVRYPQQPQFFLPIFVALAVTALELPRYLLRSGESSTRRAALWLGAMGLCMSAGMLREATIIPSTDQPIVDLVLAFGPFTLGAMCLYAAVPVGLGHRPDRIPGPSTAAGAR